MSSGENGPRRGELMTAKSQANVSIIGLFEFWACGRAWRHGRPGSGSVLLWVYQMVLERLFVIRDLGIYGRFFGRAEQSNKLQIRTVPNVQLHFSEISEFPLGAFSDSWAGP